MHPKLGPELTEPLLPGGQKSVYMKLSQLPDLCAIAHSGCRRIAQTASSSQPLSIGFKMIAAA